MCFWNASLSPRPRCFFYTKNLKTFDVDINNSVELKKIFEGENIFIAESGIKSKKDIEYLKQHNINVFLIGESLMKGDFFET